MVKSTAASPTVNLESDDDAVIMDTSPSPSPSLRVNSKSMFKKPKSVPGKKTKEKQKLHTSIVWNEFVKLPMDEDGIIKATCQWCGKMFLADSHHGTSNLHRHLLKCLKRKQAKQDGEGEGSVPMLQNKITQEEFREMLAEAIVKHNLPFSFVEYEGIRKIFSYLNSDVKHISRNTSKADVLKLYKNEKDDVKKKLKSIPGRICLTSDLWTSITSEGYICLTAHYVDENWQLKNIILNFCHMPPPHTGTLLSEKILSFLEEWGIEKKIFSITLDNASNNDNCQDFIKQKLNEQGLLLCDGIFFHVRCGAHILNLIVQEGLKVIDDSVIKIRETMKYLKGSETRMCRFDECVKIVGMKRTKGLRLDVCTRWNATYDMIDSAMRYRSVLNRLGEEDANFKHCPSRDEWNRVERITRFLKPFNDITTLFSGTDYPTANLYFQGVSRIELLLLEEMESQDSFISNMAEQMKVKFDKYWDCYSVVLACAIVLDPRYKLDYVDYIFKKIEPIEHIAEMKVESIETTLYKLFSEYEHPKPMATTNASSCVGSSSHTSGAVDDPDDDDDEDKEDDEFDHYESGRGTKTKKSQLDLYLEEPRLDKKQNSKLEVLSWWKEHYSRFPELSLMARDLLSIPITTVASESSFSTGKKILTPYRSRLLPENVEATLCTKSWLYGFEDEDANEIGQLELQFASMNICSAESATNVE